MLIVLVLLIVDYVFSQQTRDRPWSMLLTDHNTSDTAIKYGLLLYILYVFSRKIISRKKQIEFVAFLFSYF